MWGLPLWSASVPSATLLCYGRCDCGCDRRCCSVWAEHGTVHCIFGSGHLGHWEFPSPLDVSEKQPHKKRAELKAATLILLKISQKTVIFGDFLCVLDGLPCLMGGTLDDALRGGIRNCSK